MPQNWKTYKLGEICSKIGSGSTPRGGKEAYIEEGISLIRSQNVLDFSFSTDGLAFISDQQAHELRNVTIESRDVLINITGDSVARVCQVPDEYIPARVNQHVAILRADQNQLSPELLKYVLLTPRYKNLLLTMAGSGATRNALTKVMLEDFEITIPESLPEQRAIASILSSLDDKIELNLQMNKTLEEMAMTLYKHWFVDFEFPHSPPSEGSAQQGVVNSPPLEEYPQGEVVNNHPAFQAPLQRRGSASGESGRNTTNYMSLPYNPKLKERAKELRKAGNLAEVLFWQQVNKKQFMGLDFDRQKIIGNYIVDFYCANVNVVVEIDGSSHDEKQEYDAARDAYLESLGLTVIHIVDAAVKNDLKEVMEELRNHPAFQAPLHRRGSESAVNSPPLEEYPKGEVVKNPQTEVVNNGYKSSGGKFIDSELGPIPEGWEVKCMLDIVDLLSGGTPKTSVEEYWNGDICWVSAKDIGNGGIYINDTEKKITKLGVSKSSTKVLPEDTVILVARGSVGKFGMIAKEMAMNQSCYGLYTKGEYSQGLVYLMFSKLIEQFQRMAYGSVFDTITTATFKSTNVVVPPYSFTLELKAQIDPLFDQLKQNILENESLTNLRDTLLPKLISGEVRVKDVEQTVAAVL